MFLYNLIKIKERKAMYLYQMKCVTDEEENVMVKENYIKYRWKKYFQNIFNEGYKILSTLIGYTRYNN